MENDLRIDSFDYRTELLSPAPPGENVTLTVEPSWRLNMDRFHLPERRMDSHLSIGYYIKTLSKFSRTIHILFPHFLTLLDISKLYIVGFLQPWFALKTETQLINSFSGRHRKIAGYYKRQEKLLKGYNEVDTFTELGILPGSLTQVCNSIFFPLL